MSTELQPYTGVEAQDEARRKLLDNYNPKEHLIKISTKQGMKDYYPAAWRLYELSLRYADANFATRLIYHNEETGAIIVRARLYLGPDYKTSPKKAEAMKQGTFAQLDKIETAAKARAARDFGISTELALDMEDEDNGNGEVISTLARSTVVSPAPHVVDSQPATAQATSASPQPAQARQEPAQGREQATAIRAKVDALLGEFATLFPNAAKKPDWQTALAQRVWGEVPEAYTLDHYRTLNAYYLKQKSAGKSARVQAM